MEIQLGHEHGLPHSVPPAREKIEHQAANHERTLLVKSVDLRRDKQHHVDLLLSINCLVQKGGLEAEGLKVSRETES